MRPAAPGAPPPGIDHCLALLAYEGPARELIARLKYRDARASVAWLAGAMAALGASLPVDAVTWAPTTRRRRVDRGFDQAALLAHAVARCRAIRAVALLERGPGEPQTGRSAGERRSAPPTFMARRRSPPRVMVIDDVLTTGGTLSAAARALRDAGATTVIALVAGRTPLKVGSGSADP